ncbi:hypothetical protein HDU93_007242 [Gonapodya sp. JEL0774]|nr:hypothetical protein HDU93_007242 [Gonapodya sp. JEL0774]
MDNSETSNDEVSKGFVIVDIEDIAGSGGGMTVSIAESAAERPQSETGKSSSEDNRPSLTASRIGQNFTFNCDLFLNRAANAEYIRAQPLSDVGAIARARISRGFSHEVRIAERLRHSNLLLDLRNNLDPVATIEREVLTGTRPEFYAYGLEYEGEGLFNDDYKPAWGTVPPIRFGRVKPDFVKFEVEHSDAAGYPGNDKQQSLKKVKWWVIDAKASSQGEAELRKANKLLMSNDLSAFYALPYC